ncbi:MAG: SPOR domain-containing protein [Nitrospirae bacterium]|nr:SPOR domain-containing protein [Nitrospirota bacterium]
MRNFRNSGTRFGKRDSGFNPRYLFFLIIAAAIIVTIAVTVSKVKTKTLASDITPGKILLKEIGQTRKAPHTEDNSGVKPLDGQADGQVNNDKKEGETTPDSFTFYKSLNGREGKIIPLSGAVEKAEKEKKGEDAEVKTIQPEKILQVEEKIDKNIEKIVKKENIFSVQIAAFSSESTASDIINRLKQFGHSPYLVREEDKNGKKLIKVRVGRFASMTEAQSVANALKKDGYDTYVIKN